MCINFKYKLYQCWKCCILKFPISLCFYYTFHISHFLFGYYLKFYQINLIFLCSACVCMCLLLLINILFPRHQNFFTNILQRKTFYFSFPFRFFSDGCFPFFVIFISFPFFSKCLSVFVLEQIAVFSLRLTRTCICNKHDMNFRFTFRVLNLFYSSLSNWTDTYTH